jgi:hypothetical protein
MNTETLVGRIRHWTAASEQVAQKVALQCHLRPDQVDVQSAAMQELGVEDPYQLLERDWTAEELFELVKKVDFRAQAQFEEVVLNQSIIPRGVPRRIDEETVTFQSEKWRIHLSDADPFPSRPHAHNLYNDLTMDLTNGDLYRGRKKVGRLGKNELIEFRSRVIRIQLPPLEG